MSTAAQRARALYDASPARPHSPAWDQLGPVTQSVWIERVPEAEREAAECAHSRASYGDPVRCLDCYATYSNGTWWTV